MSNNVGLYSDDSGRIHSHTQKKFPLPALLTLALSAFITILTEALPAGMLNQMAASLDTSPSMAGQTVTIYAIGSLIAAIPLTAATQTVSRRKVLLTSIIGFAIANTVTAFSSSYFITMFARFIGGVSAGLLWALLAGYAARMVSDHLKGRAIAIALAGTPLALSLGVPAGTFLSTIIGWRACFAIMSVLAVILIFLIRFLVPDFPGQTKGKSVSLNSVIFLKGVKSVLFVVFSYILAHNILYTYIAPFLQMLEMENNTDLALLIFGISSLVGIWIVGVLIDSHLRPMTIIATTLFGLTAVILSVENTHPIVIFVAIAIWGISFGGAATLFQTAMTRTAGDAADVALSMLVTAWNAAIAAGGILGGILLEGFGVVSFPPALLILLILTLIVVIKSKTGGFSIH
ncbi:MFS transporter [Pectobacterium carotovorum subsp. carotovorum]|nr:MFS transporter [Pectobacterium carotovorum subsp. carotovorum]